MRDLARNKRTIWYALRIGEVPNVDTNGHETGETTPYYGDPVALRCNISAVRGEVAAEAFGTYPAYSRTVTVTDPNCPLAEDSIVWFDADPAAQPHNYIVVQRADSKNGLLFTLREVAVNR